MKHGFVLKIDLKYWEVNQFSILNHLLRASGCRFMKCEKVSYTKSSASFNKNLLTILDYKIPGAIGYFCHVYIYPMVYIQEACKYNNINMNSWKE